MFLDQGKMEVISGIRLLFSRSRLELPSDRGRRGFGARLAPCSFFLSLYSIHLYLLLFLLNPFALRPSPFFLLPFLFLSLYLSLFLSISFYLFLSLFISFYLSLSLSLSSCALSLFMLLLSSLVAVAYLTILTLVLQEDILMYNFKVQEHSSGYHVRLYSQPVLSGSSSPSIDSDSFLAENIPDSFERFASNNIEKDAVAKGFTLVPRALQSQIPFKHSPDKEASAVSALSRARSTIVNLARSVIWDYFVTFTFSPEKVDRTDYSACYKAVSSYLNSIMRSNPDFKYLAVPELHKDGCSFHFHALVSGLPDNALFFSGHYSRGKKPVPVYNLSGFDFGFTTATKVKSSIRCTRYILKYITKDLSIHTQGRHRYIRSHNFQPLSPFHALLLLKNQLISDILKSKSSFYKFVLSYRSYEVFELPLDFDFHSFESYLLSLYDYPPDFLFSY